MSFSVLVFPATGTLHPYGSISQNSALVSLIACTGSISEMARDQFPLSIFRSPKAQTCLDPVSGGDSDFWRWPALDPFVPVTSERRSGCSHRAQGCERHRWT